MTKKTYPQICRERANAATEGPWGCIPYDGWTLLSKVKGILGEVKGEKNIKFIAHARTDVPELARRLERAIALLREADMISSAFDSYAEIADELEAPIVEEKREERI